MAAPVIELRQITKDNVGKVVAVKVRADQERFVANNACSLAEAYVQPEHAWPRAIYAGDQPVGFVMLFLAGPDHPDAKGGQATYYLWRFMIGAEHQGNGYGRAAINAVVDFVKSRPGRKILDTSYVPGDGCPEPFYTRLGFTPTGEVDDGEVGMQLVLPG